MNRAHKRAALFDLDRTLVRVNTAALYVRWLRERGEARKRDLVRSLFWLGQYTLGIIDVGDVARRVALPLKGMNEARFAETMREWVNQDVLQYVSQAARAEVERRRNDGYICAVLTASTTYSAGPLAESLGIEHVLASRLEVLDGHFTGMLTEPFCYGHGKVLVTERWAATNGVDLTQSVFYSDSISDRPMLERVGGPHVVNGDPRLSWLARRRGWPRARWV